MVTILERPSRMPGGSMGKAGSSDSRKLSAMASANKRPIKASLFTLQLRFCAAICFSHSGTSFILVAFGCNFNQKAAILPPNFNKKISF
jgi:hypothetical protein